jgi:FAD/FMN-containing dehydrogenase
LLDRTFLDVAASGGATDVPPGSEAVLLAEVEGSTHEDAGALAERLATAFRAAGASEVRLALDAATETVLWELRHRASPTIARLHPHLRSLQFIEDGAVPPARLPEYVRGVREALARHGVRGVIFGHAGDGPVHVNPLLDVDEPTWREQVAGILDDVTALTQRLGGTLAGEHGDGRLRTPLLPRLRGEETMALYAEVKAAFDPDGLLNPGVKVPLPGQRPLGAIKYDPALPPLPEPARRVLDHVARERAYAEPRLALLERAVKG